VNAEALRARAIAMVRRDALGRRHAAMMVGTLAVGVVVGLLLDRDLAPVAVGAAIVAGLAYRSGR
jgi:hypothetical protein